MRFIKYWPRLQLSEGLTRAGESAFNMGCSHGCQGGTTCWREASAPPHVDLLHEIWIFLYMHKVWKDTQKLVTLGVLGEGIGWLLGRSEKVTPVYLSSFF